MSNRYKTLIYKRDKNNNNIMNFEQILISLSYFGIFLLITCNGIISFPSSQIIYIIAGVFASKGDLNLLYIILVGGFANALGNVILYEISRKKGLKYTLKLFKFLSMLNPEKEVKKIEIAFKKKGTWFLFIGKLVNPIKIFIPIPAGITKMNRGLFSTIVLITSTLWATIFTTVGFYFGESYENFGWVGLVMIIIFSIVIYYFYKYLNSDEIIKELEN